MTTRKRDEGEFCWFNLMTPNPDEARGFYGELFGWRYQPMGNGGHTVSLGEQPIGAIFPNEMPGAPKTPPMIGVMFKVASADSAAAKVSALGGQSQAPFNIAGNLRMSVCHDPDGAQFDLWESKAMHGSEVDSSLHGAPVWVENCARDPRRNGAFYAQLFGWTLQPMSPGDGMGFEYTVFNLGQRGVAGMMPIVPQMGDFQPDWVVYFNSSDVDATAAKVEKLGGKVCQSPMDIAGVGRMAGIRSPQGVNCAILNPRPR